MRSGRLTKIKRRTRRGIVLSALAAVLTAVGIAFAAPPAVTAPTITSQPANPTNQTSASFKYTDSQAGVTFQCQLDGAGYTACGTGPSGAITYTGPLANGSHTFKVQAVSGTKTSSAASYTWTIDTTPPAPAITSQPANPTNQTSASFKYTDSQAGVSYQCQLDGGGFKACEPSGITYSGLEAGSHTFKVQAVSFTKNSTAATYTWVVDTAPPTVTLSFPANKHTYREESWNVGCSAPGLCGNAKDPRSGVTSVVVSIQQGSGNWWGGSSFNKTSEFFNTATLASPGATTTEWSYPLSLPEDGSYTVHVRATDAVGNTISAESQLATTFKIDSTPPPPSLTSFPPEQTTATTATFGFTDEEAGVTFLCKLDAASFASCKSPKAYSGLSQGAHTFSVEAKDKKRTNLSTVTSYTWTVSVEGQPFAISGSVSGSLLPGVSRPLPLAVSNPNGVPIIVTSLAATAQAGSTKAGCDGPTNLQITQSNVSGTNTLTVPAHGQVTLPSGTVSAPQVLMKNLPTNQDACQGASFAFNYSGSAHS
jgi:large repetitive protein